MAFEYFSKVFDAENAFQAGAFSLQKGRAYEAVGHFSRALILLTDTPDAIELKFRVLFNQGLAYISLAKLEDAALAFGRIPDCIQLKEELLSSDVIGIFREKGLSHYQKEEFNKSYIYYNALRKCCSSKFVQIIGYVGTFVTRWKIDEKALSSLTSSLLECPARKAQDLPYNSKKDVEQMARFWVEKSSANINDRVHNLAIANEIIDVLDIKLADKELVIEINITLCGLLYTKDKKKRAKKKFSKFISTQPGTFLKEFLQSEMGKIAKEEQSGNVEAVLKDLWLLSFFISSVEEYALVKNSVTVIIQLHERLFEIEVKLSPQSSGHLDKAFEAVESLVQILQNCEAKDEELALKTKDKGNFFLKKKKFSYARQLYKLGLTLLPPKNQSNVTSTSKRDLLSNLSYAELLLKDYQSVISNAKLCISLDKKWPKGHLRLGKGYSGQEMYRDAHKAFKQCYSLSNKEQRPEILKDMFMNICCTATEREQKAMSLPDNVPAEALPKCLSLLCSESSPCACKAVEYILTCSKFNDIAIANAVCVIDAIQNNFTDSCLKLLLQRGADPNLVVKGISPLQAALHSSKLLTTTVVEMIRRGADVGVFIPHIKHEPHVHTFLRLCLRTQNVDLFKAAFSDIDVTTIDENGNTFLHILANEESSESVNRCLSELLNCGKIDPSIKNRKKERATDILLDPNDKRRVLLAEYETIFHSISTAINNHGKKKKNRKAKRNVSNVNTVADSLSMTKALSRVGTRQVGHSKEIHSHASKPLENAQSRLDVFCASPKSFEKGQNCINPLEELRKNISVGIQNFVEIDAPVRKNADKSVKTNDVDSLESTDDVPPDAHDPSNDPEPQFSEICGHDIDNLDGLPWEVQCSSEFLKKLKDRKLKAVIKKKILQKVEFLASGDWRPELAIKLRGAWTSKGICIYEAKIDKGGRILWEKAVAFSERCSVGSEDCTEVDTNAREKFIYTDVIRLWNFTLDHNEVPRLINQIVSSHNRGKSCTLKKNLKSLPMESCVDVRDDIRVPQRYIIADVQNYPREEIVKSKQVYLGSTGHHSEKSVFFPPGSPDEREYHILKFYSLSSAMANSILANNEQSVDFPFQVSELEHSIIRLRTSPPASILLLGRSGTGKTTCCIYRLWSQFKTYWERALTAGRHIATVRTIIEDGTVLKDTNPVEQVKKSNSKGAIECAQRLNCGCNESSCLCAIASFRAASGFGPISSNIFTEAGNGESKQDNGSCSKEELAVDSEKEREMGGGEQEQDGQYRHLRQLFITKNKVLCREVRRNFKDLCCGIPEASGYMMHSMDEMAVNLNNLNEFSFPLFLDSRDLLFMMDATLPGPSFFERDSNGKTLKPVPGWGESDIHLEILPLFDHEDEFESDNEQDEILTEAPSVPSFGRQGSVAAKEVTYALFSQEIWPKIDRKFKSSYHPSLIWTEIRSFIKGSVEALLSKSGFMSKEEYKSVGRKKAPNFSGNREIIYQMFCAYDNICRERNLFDELDVLYSVYQRLNKFPLPDWLFDELYVDETQDFTEAELFTLIRCCQNPNHLFFTGDTAQSIMRGVAFRFSDLRSLFYKAKTALSDEKNSTINVPEKVYQLTYNYRSHRGILNLASAIVNILGELFPESFDKLENDVGLFDGPKPVILEASDFSDLALLLSGARRKTSPIEFGAHQVVIVATEESKTTLPEELSCALVLSIYEAKGLEFDDVLLYNFFKDSQAREEWRVINNFTNISESKRSQEKSAGTGIVRKEAIELTRSSKAQRLRPLEFDYNKHKILNSELKHLYTALTRARVNIWIYDEDRENRAPMFEYFKRNQLVDTVKLDPTEAIVSTGRFAEQSSSTDWERQGLLFYRKELWRPAYKCFERAENRDMLDRCSAHLQAFKAYQLAIMWRDQKSNSFQDVQKEYLTAALMYLKSGMAEEALICMNNAREWTLLANFFEYLNKYHEAAKYYVKAGLLTQAAECYVKYGDFRNAVDLLFNKEMFSGCIDVLKRYDIDKTLLHPVHLRPPRSTITLTKVAIKAADLYWKRQQIENMKSVLGVLKLDDQLSYLSKPECEKVLIQVLIDNGRLEDAARIHIDKGRYLDAAALTQDKKTKGLCHLEYARMLYRNWIEKPSGNLDNTDNSLVIVGKYPCPDPLINAVETCVKLLHDSSYYAEACEMEGFINACSASSRRAVKCYTEVEDHFSCLICNTFLFEIGEGDTSIFASNINKVYHIVCLLAQEVNLENAKLLRVCRKLFGIEGNKESGFVVNLNKLQYRLCLLDIKLNIAKQLKAAFSNKGSAKAGNYQLTMLILGFVDKLSSKLRNIYEQELASEKTCQNYINGVAHIECYQKHQIPDSNCIQRRLNAFFAIIQLDGVTRTFIQRKNGLTKQDLQHLNYLKNYSFDECMVAVCRAFYNEFISYTYYLSPDNLTGALLSSCLPSMLFLKEQILWYTSHIWESAEDTKKFGDINLFLEISVLSNFISVGYSQTIVDKIKEKIFDRYSNMFLPQNEGAIFNKRIGCIQTFHTLFAESKDWLHTEGCLIESIHCLIRRTIRIPLGNSKTLPLPDLLNVILLLEFNIALCFISLSFLSPRKNLNVILPDFYFEGIEFWSGLYTKYQDSYTAIDSIEWVSEEGKNLITALVDEMVYLMIGEKFEKLNMFKMALSKECMQLQSGQRFFVLVLVVLANSHLFSLSSANHGKIVDKIRHFANVNVNGEDYLSGALQQCVAIKDGKDASKELKCFLENQGKDIVHCNWEKLRNPSSLIQKDQHDGQKRLLNIVETCLPPNEEKKKARQESSYRQIQNCVPFKEQNPESKYSVLTKEKEVRQKLLKSSQEPGAQISSGDSKSLDVSLNTERIGTSYSIESCIEGSIESGYSEIQEVLKRPGDLIKRRKTAFQIQCWWKRIMSKRKITQPSSTGAEKLVKTTQKLVDHKSYVRELTCIPCGKAMYNDADLNQHILTDESHDNNAKDFDTYQTYERDVSSYIEAAEDVFDQETQFGVKASELDLARQVDKHLSSVIMEKNLIEAKHRWTELANLKCLVELFKEAYHQLKEEVNNINREKNYTKSHECPDSGFLTEDDFQLVTKRKSKRSGGSRKHQQSSYRTSAGPSRKKAR